MIGIIRSFEEHSLEETSSMLPKDRMTALNRPLVEDASSSESSAVDNSLVSSSSNGVPPPSARTALQLQQHLYRPATIMMLGDSYIRRIRDYEARTYGNNANLGFDYPVANVYWHGVGGATVRKLRVDHLEYVYNVKPDIVFVHVGGNDLTAPYNSASDVGEELEDLVDDLLDMQVLQVVVSQQVYRYNRHMPISPRLYNEKVASFNYYNKLSYSPLVPNNNNVRYWYHHGLWNRRYATISQDGVHLNSRGSKNFLRSIRGACLQAVARIRPQLILPPRLPPRVTTTNVARISPSVRVPTRPVLREF